MQVPGHFGGPCHLPTPEELLELGAVERGDVHREANQILSSLSRLLGSFEPPITCARGGAGPGGSKELVEEAEEVGWRL